jgi:hypothetical protein
MQKLIRESRKLEAAFAKDRKLHGITPSKRKPAKKPAKKPVSAWRRRNLAASRYTRRVGLFHAPQKRRPKPKHVYYRGHMGLQKTPSYYDRRLTPEHAQASWELYRSTHGHIPSIHHDNASLASGPMPPKPPSSKKKSKAPKLPKTISRIKKTKKGFKLIVKSKKKKKKMKMPPMPPK